MIFKKINRFVGDLSELCLVKKHVLGDIRVLKDEHDGDMNAQDSSVWEKFSGQWCGVDEHYLFSTKYEVGQEFDGKTIVLALKTAPRRWAATNPQFHVYINGEFVASADVNHTEFTLTQSAVVGDVYDILLRGYTGLTYEPLYLDMFIYQLDKEVRELYYNVYSAYEYAVLLDENNPAKVYLGNLLDKIADVVDFSHPGSQEYYASIQTALKIYDEASQNPLPVTIHAVGHTHIDVGWLWRIRQSREKAVRSFRTVLRLMDEYPEYIFMSSQPVLYQFVKEDYPELYEKIKQRVAEGRFEPEGSMFVEADCNLTSGESLIRQIMFGKRFFKEEFGKDNEIVWLPDVFGYSPALPQIMAKCGIKYFMTTKISWNESNILPNDTFIWEGIDGSEVLTHFGTNINAYKTGQTDYNGAMTPTQILGTWTRYQNKDISSNLLNSYGYGDGGGGTTPEMIEVARRFKRGITGAPTVNFSTAGDYFRLLEKDFRNSKRQPRWVGELYFELHRGTLTSIGRIKKDNRKSEILYREAELWGALSGGYDRSLLNSGWSKILINQFHDILPGSSIPEVYEDSDIDYKEIAKIGQSVLDNALAQLSEQAGGLVVFNSLCVPRSDVVELPVGSDIVALRDENGVYPVQHTQKGAICFLPALPAGGYATFDKLQSAHISQLPSSKIQVTETHMSNKFFDITLDKQGNIISLINKDSGRQVIKSGERANVITAYEDRPYIKDYDAWDINSYYGEKAYEPETLEVSVFEEGPVRGALKIVKRFGQSVITQFMYIYSGLPRIDFDTHVDWKETYVLLRTNFPVDIHSNVATFDIQFGNITRPTTMNNSWDSAQFEVMGHKWADISEDSFGVALLSDCKYGYSAKRGVLGLSLLKSAIYPNQLADLHEHQFTYSLYPHNGDVRSGGVAHQGYKLNHPVKVVDTDRVYIPVRMSFIESTQSNVIVETVKCAEDGDGVIVRAYENAGGTTKAALILPFANGEAIECDMLENSIGQGVAFNRRLDICIKPYEVKTWRIKEV